MADDDSVRAHRALDAFLRRVRTSDIRDQLDTAAAELAAAFAQANIAVRLLKGPVLARSLYTYEEQRGYSDVDFLVEPDSFRRAREVLRQRGYVHIEEQLGIVEVAGALHSETWTDGKLVIDLHWRLPGTGVDPQAAWRVLTAEGLDIEVAGRRVSALGRSALALHVATHAAQHGQRHRPGMRDLELALDRWPFEVWRQAAAMAADIGASSSFAAGLQQTQGGVALARQLGLPALSELNWAPVHDPARPRGTFHLEELAEADSVARRARALRKALLPPQPWIVWQYPWARRRRLLVPLAYAAHLGRAPLWALRAGRYARRKRAR